MSDLDGGPTIREPGPAPCQPGWVPLWVLLGVLLTQAVWIWALPPFRGVDEIDHVYRAASVALGDVHPTQLPADGRGTLVEVPPGIVKDAQRQCRALLYNGTSTCTPESTLPNGDVMVASSAAGYSPVAYAVIGTLARPWDGVTADYVMRTVASVINALLLALAAWCLMTRSRTPWPVTGLILGLTPMAIFTTMLPAPNGMELSAATLLWCALLGLQAAESRAHPWLLASATLAVAILGSVRETGPLYVLLIAGFVFLASPRSSWAVLRRRWRWVVGTAFVALVATLYQVYWLLHHPPVSVHDDRRPFDLVLILGQVVLWVFQWMGAFPFRGQPASTLTYVACGIAFTLVFVEGLRRGDAKSRVAVVVVVACLALPLVFTLMTFAEKGTFWQGRYALPLLAGAPILIGLSLDTPGRTDRLVPRAVVVLGVVSTAAAVVHVVNADLNRPSSAEDPHWHAPAWYAVVLVAALAGVAFGRAVASASRHGAPTMTIPQTRPDLHPGRAAGDTEVDGERTAASSRPRPGTAHG
jgi:hypothetical protein